MSFLTLIISSARITLLPTVSTAFSTEIYLTYFESMTVLRKELQMTAIHVQTIQSYIFDIYEYTDGTCSNIIKQITHLLVLAHFKRNNLCLFKIPLSVSLLL